MENKLLIQDIVDTFAIKEGLTKKKSEAFIKALFETIEEGLIEDKFVKVKGLGTFKIISVGERESVNINTGERFSIEGHNKITFTPDTLIRDLVNRPFAHFQTVVINDDVNMEELEQVETEDAIEKPDTNSENEENEDLIITTENEDYSDSNQTSDNKTTKEEKIQEALIDSTNEIEEEERNDVCKEINAKDYNDKEKEQLSDSKHVDINDIHSLSKEKERENPNDSGGNKECTLDKEEINAKNKEEYTLKQVSPVPQQTNQKTTQTQILKENEDTNTSESRVSTTAQKNNSASNTNEKDTASHEQIQYIIKEVEHKKNIWKITSIVLTALLILILTYFAGYFRLFCPCELFKDNVQQNVTIPSKPTTRPKIVNSTQVQDSSKIVDTNATTLGKQDSQATTNTVEAGFSHTPSISSNEKQERAEKVVEKSEQYTQVEGAKYEIIGTRKEHQIKSGETIRNIALQEYGSKGYAIYIITHNHLEDPNNVAVGTYIKLPELTKRK